MATVASHSDIAQFVPDYSAQFLGELQGILEKAQRFSGASGVAIAFVEGEELVTKSGLGASAPEVGSRSLIQGSFTGLAVQTCEVQRCDDASCDSRVDSQACAALGVASLVIVPIGDKKNCLGVLAAFAPKPNAFTPTHVALLRTLADIVVELYNRYPNSAPSVRSEPKPDAPKPPASVKTEAPPQPKHFVPKPVFTAPTNGETDPKRFESPTASNSMVAPSGIRLTDAPVVVPPVSPLPKVEAKPVTISSEPLRVQHNPEPARFAPVIDIRTTREKQEEVLSPAADIGPVMVAKHEPAKQEPQLFSNYGYSAIGALEQQQKEESGSKRVLMIFAAMVIVVALATGGYLFSHRSQNPSVVSASEAQAQPPAAHETTSTPPAPVQGTPATSEPAAKAVPVERLPEPAAKEPEHIARTERNLPVPAMKAEPAPLLVASTDAVPRPVAVENVDAPSVIVGGTADAGHLLGMVKTAQPKGVFKASSVTPPELMRRVPPIYPSFAKQLRLKSERVVLNASIGKDGSVTDVKLVRGKQLFVDAAISAVRQWKYKPAYLNGEPVPATVEIDLEFTN
jgi:TonB family protein